MRNKSNQGPVRRGISFNGQCPDKRLLGYALPVQEIPHPMVFERFFIPDNYFALIVLQCPDNRDAG